MNMWRGKAPVAVLLTFGLLAAACGDCVPPTAAVVETTPQPDGADGADAVAAAPTESGPLRVAVVTPSAENDLAFSQSIVDALHRMRDAGLFSEVAVSPGLFVVEDAGLALRDYAQAGYDLVIAHGSQYGGLLEEIAPEFPDTAFAWGTSVETFGQPNISVYTAASNEGGYVMGLMAAELAGDAPVGVIGPIEIGDAKLYVDGFIDGVEARGGTANSVYTDSFADVQLAAEAAQAFIDNGHAVLTGTAQMTVGAIGVALESGVPWFGTQSNQTSAGPEVVVASQVYRWDVVLEPLVRDIQMGLMGGNAYEINLANGGLAIEYNDAYDLPADVRAIGDRGLVGAVALPGDGVTVTMARGDWVETKFQNYVVQLLLEELGYEVSEPESIAPADFYPAAARGEYDLWASSWPLIHTAFLEAESPDGGTVGDKADYVGVMMVAGALQGLLVDVPSVEQFGFKTLEELLDNPDAVAHFDSDGDGRVEINGCDEGWGCHRVINDTIALNGWGDRIEQVSAVHSELFRESQASFEAGGPVLQYVWTPTAFVGKLVPGRDVLWLAIQPDHALEGQGGASAVGDACTNDPCTTMFTPSDIVVTANLDFLEANPAAAHLLQNFELDPLAVAEQALAIEAGANSEEAIKAAAADWIAANRGMTVDPLIAGALAARPLTNG